MSASWMSGIAKVSRQSGVGKSPKRLAVGAVLVDAASSSNKQP